MMKKLSLSVLCLLFTLSLLADVRLPNIFGTGMVLQRNQPIPVWGWADPGEKITVAFNKQTVKTKAGKDGKWMINFKQEAAGGPYTLTVKGKNELRLDNVMVGEVWLCSGQSNMEWTVGASSDKRYAQEIRDANSTMIRHIKVKNTVSDTPAADVPTSGWELANDSNNVAHFTSVGYFFAKKLQQELNVAVGLINSSWGGTMVETWISREALDKTDAFDGAITKTFSDVQATVKNGKMGPNDYPSLLFNGMINPLIPYAIKGAIWYQGEANASRAAQYKTAFPLMITDWRTRWQEGEFPFYFVQLASFKANHGDSRHGSSWAELREAQTATLALPNTGMAVTLDIGTTDNIHPNNKKDVGERLAAIALAKQYGQAGEYSGPVFGKMEIDGNKALVSFTHADKGLVVKDKYGYLEGFELAGEDKQWHYAKAEINDGRVVVHSDSVSAPVAVRYGWADDMPEANLYNQQGFPAVPFRTDTWPGLTDDKKFTVK